MAKKSVPRLRDVAEKANVSMAAASRILRGDTAPFGKETCERVQRTAQEIGWRQNLLVSGIQTGQTGMIGVMIPPYDSFWINVISGIHATLAQADFLPITIWLGDLKRSPYFEEEDEKGFAQINRLLDRRVDALIMWPQIAIAYQKYFSKVVDDVYPVVAIDIPNPKIKADIVLSDELASTKLAAEHLLKLGHRRIGCLGERQLDSHEWSNHRINSFLKFVKQASGSQFAVEHLNDSGSDGYEAAVRLLKDDIKPTAVFAASDHLARCVYQAASDLGLSIPTDLSVVGYSNLDFTTEMQPPLTTIEQRPFEIGSAAAKLVLKRLKKSASPSMKESIAGELIDRSSTAKPK